MAPVVIVVKCYCYINFNYSFMMVKVYNNKQNLYKLEDHYFKDEDSVSLEVEAGI